MMKTIALQLITTITVENQVAPRIPETDVIATNLAGKTKGAKFPDKYLSGIWHLVFFAEGCFMRPGYEFDGTYQGSVLEAIIWYCGCLLLRNSRRYYRLYFSCARARFNE
ncbi:hypothetical protein Holit_00654 [Hollandina sp. SP2]